MFLGVLSDTHGDLRRTRDAVERLKQHALCAVLHCGDIVSPEVVPLLNPWPAHFVFGNCDAAQSVLRRTIADCSQTCHERFGTLTLQGRQIAFLHGDDAAALDEAARCGQYDLVCYGHTHKFEQHRVGKTLVLNPGAVHRAAPPGCAVVNLDSLTVERIILND